MKNREFLAMSLAWFLFVPVATVEAHNVIPMPWSVASLGKPTTTTININGMEDEPVWASITPFDIADYGSGSPLFATVSAFHKADGIYLLIVVNDNAFATTDGIQIRFDVPHDPTPSASAAWGIEVLRDGQASWGLGTDQGTWDTTMLGTVGNCGPGTNIAVCSSPTTWTAEIHLPTGPPSNLNLATGTVGIHFMLMDAQQMNGALSAAYTQWPAPTMADVNGLNTLFGTTPDKWGNYEFDPATTFPDIAVTDVRNAYDGPENYRKISHTQTNLFQVRVQNPDGTILPAQNVRLNLYLAAIGIGEPWHRLDTAAVLDADCSAPTWASDLIDKSEVCSDSTSLPDISTQSNTNIVNNTAQYTIKNGMPMNRLGGESISIADGFNDWIEVLEWNTTNSQDSRFTEVVVGGTTYRRQHQCMKAEAIVPNDRNSSNNVRQVNMDFVCVPGDMLSEFFFTLGWAGFGRYDAGQGKDMFLQVELRNMDPQFGWSFQLEGEGLQRLADNVFRARVQGLQSLPLKLSIGAPPARELGTPLKENLMVPPTAGGKGHPRANIIRSGDKPVYVEVKPGSLLWIANYAFDENDIQYVDLDGGGFLPPNGPEGLPLPYLDKLLETVSERFRLVLAPGVPLGALVGSFDKFHTAFEVGQGVEVRVPDDKKYLALAINGVIGLYNDNTGTGFRVKVIERAGGNQSLLERIFSPVVLAQEQVVGTFQIAPLRQVMPTLCIRGYEAIAQEWAIGGQPHELYRHIGEVCWGIINIYPTDRSKKPDKGDRTRCGYTGLESFGLSFFVTFLGLAVLGRRAWRKTKRKKQQARF